MYYPDEKEYITLVFSLLDEFTERKQTLVSKGIPIICSATLGKPRSAETVTRQELASVATFSGLGVLLLQLAMLMSVQWQLPIRNVTHIKTIFQ